jgi:hypothetical protein
MGKWLILGLVLTLLVASFILASQVNTALAGQIIATSTSVSVLVVGLFFLFKKSKT